MAVEFVGSVVPASPASVRPDPDYPVQAASLLDEARFDKLLIGYSASAPDGLLVANEVLTTTSRLGVVVTQVSSLAAPTIAARQFATLAAFHPGRVGMHAVVDGPDPARAGEFLEVVRLAWRSRRAFDYEGEFYRVTGARSAVRPAGGNLPIYFSGESSAETLVGAAQADVYLLAADSVPSVARRIAAIRLAAAGYGRSPRFGVSLRLLALPAGRAARHPVWVPPGMPLASGTAVSGRVRVSGNYDEAAQRLLDYVEIGVSTLVIGHDPQLEAADCAEVITRVREAAAGRRRAVI